MAAVVRAKSRSLDAFHQREGLPTSCKPLSAEKDGPATGNLDGILLVRRTVSERLALELTDCARLDFREGDGFAEYSLIPHNSRAVGLWLAYDRRSEEYELCFDDWAAYADEGRDADDVRDAVDAAVRGRVRALQEPGRRRLEVTNAVGEVFDCTGYAVWAFWPAPGWRRRATVTEYDPYRPLGRMV